MRLFVALSIPADVRKNLSSLIDVLRSVDAQPRWINPEKLHITLKWVGEVPSDQVAPMGAALEKVQDAQPVDFELRDTGFFPDARRPSVAWVGINSSPNLARLSAKINEVLAPLGIPREEKVFVPHLTIARFKETRLSPALRSEIEKWKGRSFGKVSTAEFHLVESRLKSAGAEYTTLRSFRIVPEQPEGQDP